MQTIHCHENTVLFKNTIIVCH